MRLKVLLLIVFVALAASACDVPVPEQHSFQQTQKFKALCAAFDGIALVTIGGPWGEQVVICRIPTPR